jgi:hypothetical protein
MGGFSRSDSKNLVGDCLCLDVRQLKRVGRLEPGQTYSCKWRSGSKIVIETKPGGIELFYGISRNRQPLKFVHNEVPLSWSLCNYGSERPWFICPGCCRRAAMLYLGKTHFLCRRCQDLAYPSQRQDQYERLMYKAKKIYKRLGVKSQDDLWHAPKPKGMHRATYTKLIKQAEELEYESDRAALSAIIRYES